MQPGDELVWKKEAEVFSRYIIGREADEQSINLYIMAQQKLDIPISPRQASKLKFTLRHPSTLPAIDGALAMVNPEHAIRRKLYTMFSVLESSPAFCDKFLPQQRKGSYLLAIIWAGTRAVFNTFYGFILLPWI